MSLKATPAMKSDGEKGWDRPGTAENESHYLSRSKSGVPGVSQPSVPGFLRAKQEGCAGKGKVVGWRRTEMQAEAVQIARAGLQESVTTQALNSVDEGGQRPLPPADQGVRGWALLTGPQGTDGEDKYLVALRQPRETPRSQALTGPGPLLS